MKSSVSPVSIKRYEGKINSEEQDLVAAEEPLEIRLKYFDGLNFNEKKLAVTMRTPGNDFELVVGFLITEGIIDSYAQITKLFYCEEVKKEEEGNVVIVHLIDSITLDETLFNRNFYLNSSCGVCGKSSLDSINTICSTSFQANEPSISFEFIHQIPQLVIRDQSVFKHTGGLHASALFNLDGEMRLIREDIGRHNALDKLIGARAIEVESNLETVLFVSGRASFELIQKALVAEIPIVIAVGAPSSLAVDLAKRYDQTLIGFARNSKFNVYSGAQRIISI